MKRKILMVLLTVLMVLACCLCFSACTGEQGEQGIQGEQGETGVSIVSVEKISSSGQTDTYQITFSDDTTSQFTITNGVDGTDGTDGADGADGISISEVEIIEGELIITLSDESSLNLGTIIGENGEDGVGIADVTLSDSGDLTVTLTSGTTLELGNIKGADGVSVSKVEINDSGELEITLSNGDSTNLGNVVGADGVGIDNVTLTENGDLSVTLTNNTTLELGNIKGADGVGVSEVKINDSGELEITLSNGDSTNLGNVVGADGVGIDNVTLSDSGDLTVTLTSGTKLELGNIKGADGVGVSEVKINDSGELVITLSDTTSTNLGKVVGEDGVGIDNVTLSDSGDLTVTLTSGTTLELGNVKGADGVSVSEVKINDSGELEITLSDDTYINLGKVVGADGTNGNDGVGIDNVTLSDSGDLTVTLTSGTELELGNIKGADGVGVSEVKINESGELVITLSDSTSINLGNIKGEDGANGNDGVGIDNVTLTENGYLSVTLTNNTTLDLGNIKGADGVGVSKVEINDSGELVITLSDGNSTNLGNIKGADGTNGNDGVGIDNVTLSDSGDLTVTLTSGTTLELGNIKGADGVSVSEVKINESGELVITLSDGDSTNLGKVVGADGTNGNDGVGIDNVTLTEDGELTVTLTSGTTLELGNIKGADGVSVSEVKINESGELVITLSDGSSTNLGNIIGEKGETGEKGTGVSNITLSDTYELTITLTDGTSYNLGSIRGETGKSAYELYKETYGYDGTETEWIYDLVNGNLADKITYTVTFDSDGGTEITAQTVEKGGKVTRPEDPEKDGYIFIGWYCGSEEWSFIGYTVTGNITLTAVWQEEYDLSAISFNNAVYTYDGTQRAVTLTGDIPEGLTVAYADNVLTDAGSTTATAILTDSYGIVRGQFTATLTIEKATLSVTMDSAAWTYTGDAYSIYINETLPDGVSVAYSNNGQTNAGMYSVVATVTVTDNYNEVADVTATLTINKATLSVTMDSAAYTYTGIEYSIYINETLPDGVSVAYSNNGQTNAGTYNVVATVTVTDNYNAVADVTATLTINKADVTITADDKTSVYGEQLLSLTYTVSGTIYNNDFTPAVTKADGEDAGSYAITVTAENSNYNITTVSGTYTITKAVYDMSGIKFNSASYVYDGNERVVEIEGTLPDDVIVYYENNSLVNVGNVTATAHFVSNNGNYESIDDMTAVLVITKATYDLSNVSFDDVTYSYDGTEKQITLTGTIPAGLTVTYTDNTLTYVGSVEAAATFSGDFTNYYTVGSLTAVLTIVKGNYDLSAFIFEDTECTYDGTAKVLEGTGTLPDGVTVAYTANSYINAGTYTVTATFTGDTDNYNTIDAQTATLIINKAIYDLSGIAFDSATYTYDGTAKTIAIAGDLPDGVTVTYYNCTKTNAGTYTCTAELTGDSSNYEAIADLTATLTIEKATYDMTGVTLNGGTFTYDGTEKSLAIEGDLPNGVTVAYTNNSAIYAGEYTVTAAFTGDSNNYNAIEDLTATLTIEKATPEVTVYTTTEYLTVTDTFELAATSAVNGTITATQSVTLTVGTNSCSWLFTPDDTDNYNTVSGTLNFTVYIKITYMIQGGTAYTQTVTKGDTAENLDGTYGNDSGYSYTFLYWSQSEGGTQFDFDTQLLADTTLYAVYDVTPVTYTITYELNGGNTAETLVYSYTIEDTVVIPSLTKTGYTFTGWSGDYLTELAETVTLENATGDRTYTANFTANTYTVTLDANGGTVESTTVTVTYGEVPSVPDAEMYGYTLVGWYLNGEKISLSEAWSITYDVTLTAQWELTNPTQISTVSDLQSIVYDLSANYILTNDIDLDGAEWEMIGDASNPFDGIFEGNGYTISNFTVSTTTDYAGLFGANSGIINNLNVADVTITSGDIGASLLVGLNNGTVYNCTASGTIDVSGTYTGGLTAYNTGTVSHSSASAAITSTGDYTGGFAGYSSGTISYCSASVTLTGVTYQGGFVAYQSGGLTEYSYATGTITSTISDSSCTDIYAGGLAGYASDGAKIENSYSAVDVSVTASIKVITIHLGGLIGYVDGTSTDYIIVTGCHISGSISVDMNYSSSAASTLTSYVGGLVGYSNYGSYNTSYSDCTITTSVMKTGTEYKGTSGSTEYYCYSYVGGLIGYDANGIVTNCYSSAVISNEVYSITYYYSYTSSSKYKTAYSYTYIGGLIGYTSGTEISSSYACGQITSATEAVATRGSVDSTSYPYNRSCAYSRVGGLVGYSDSATTITNSFASIETNDITATASAGSSGYTIVSSYGGLTGYSSNLTVTNSYRYSGFTSTVELGTATNLSNFKSVNFVTNTLGWDSTVWTLANGAYPSLDLYVAE